MKDRWSVHILASALVAMMTNTMFFVTEVTAMSAMRISSPAFEHSGMIPEKYTCDGQDVNPALSVEGVPASARSLALIMDDPDAPRGTWVHWVVWNIDSSTTAIRENSVPPGAEEGMTDFRRKGYGGPCPPSGTHRYFFKLYALDRELDLSAGATKAGLEAAMKDHILARAEMIGLYRRK